MAFGIDDVFTALVGAVKLTDTIVAIVREHRKNKQPIDLEQLLQEVRATALGRINEADLALTRFERTLIEKNVDIDRRLVDIISDTPFWQAFEQHRLTQIQKTFNAMSDALYSAGDDIAALVRCRGETGAMGAAIVGSAHAKHELSEKVLYSPLGEAIKLLRQRLVEHKAALS
jgi:hypothetical protein